MNVSHCGCGQSQTPSGRFLNGSWPLLSTGLPVLGVHAGALGVMNLSGRTLSLGSTITSARPRAMVVGSKLFTTIPARIRDQRTHGRCGLALNQRGKTRSHPSTQV